MEENNIWSFSRIGWSNTCHKCCYECEEQCEFICTNVFYLEGNCIGCEYKE